VLRCAPSFRRPRFPSEGGPEILPSLRPAFALLLLVAALALPALGSAEAAPEAPPSHSVAEGRPPVRLRIDVPMSLLRLGLAGAGLGVFAWGVRLRRRGRGDHLRRTRLAALAALGALSYASYYYFFQLHHVGGLDVEDVFTYYVASKYSPEVGYFGLYECSLAALVESGGARLDDLERVRDLRSLRVIAPREAWVRGRRCKEEEFSAERWEAFRRDVTWFRSRMSPSSFRHLMVDHGYQPSPVWTAMARPLSSLLGVDVHGPVILSRADRVVVLLAILGVAWGFGLEAASIVAIVWGTGFLWRYSWIGDNYLRQVWLAAALFGICLARRGRHAASGAVLTLSALLRVFPAVFVGGHLLRSARRALATRRLPEGARRFAAGAGVALGVLVVAGFAIPGRGLGVYAEFSEKISRFAEAPGLNKVGLPALAGFLLGETGERTGEAPAWAVAAVRGGQLALVAALLVLAWRALARAEPWEGAALGFVLVPFLTQPANYYYSLVLPAALLATRRPRIGLALFATTLLWGGAGLVYYGGPRSLDAREFATESLIAVLFCLFVAREMTLPAPAVGEADASGAR
jgi:hypothetical protein